MSKAILKLEFLAGTSIEVAAAEALHKANVLDLAIKFNFNGVVLTVFQNNYADEIVNRYHAAIATKQGE
jgi:hypothetical protein|tara:strand:- start:245 stop:451 length:207 start_codon:yes stop_codon:yes gene_type:complete